MLFKRAQVLELLEISADTLRHWKKALPPISAKDGRADDYTFAELLSLAIVARATQHLRVQVSLFTEFSTELFDGVERLVRSEAYDVALFINHDQAGIIQAEDVPRSEALVLIQIQPIVTELLRKIGATRPAVGQLILPLLH